MTRRPPTILSALPTADGGLEVTWELDAFFGGSEEPEAVRIDVNGLPFPPELAGDETSVEIPAATIAALGAVSTIAVSVSFAWAGPPAEEQQSTVVVPVRSGPAAGSTGVVPAAVPVVTVERVQGRTLQAAPSITIRWRSNNYNDGEIRWGPEQAPQAFVRSIRPQGERYEGTFTTDRPIAAATTHRFEVRVVNRLHSPTWVSATAAVRSAPDHVSLRRFLEASGVPAAGSIRARVGAGGSLRRLLRG